jgi:hypothetical protein
MDVARDDFGSSIKEALAKRVAYRCSNPNCRSVTIGPHVQPTRTVNVGVAAHIAAASVGGPRFDGRQAADDRASIDNAIWLCQTCAKLVDSDVDAFSVSRLRRWKVEAEAETLRSLNGSEEDDVYPQPSTTQHLPVPRIAGEPLAAARERLLKFGWQPVYNHWSYKDDERVRSGNGPLMWRRGYHELVDACPTGLAYCRFKYRDAYGNELQVVTAGEPDGDEGDVVVWSWSIRLQEHLASTDREFSRLTTQIREEIGRAKERTATAARARRDLAIAVGGLGGSREQLYRAEAEARLNHLDLAAKELHSMEVEVDAADRREVLSRLDALLIRVTSISERSRDDAATFNAERSRM